MKKVGIAGLGPHVRGLISLLAENDVTPVVWDIEPQEGYDIPLVDLDELASTPLVFFCAPVDRARVVARRLGDIVTGQHVIVHMSRELEPETRSTLSQMLREETSTHRIGFLTGPMRHDDLAKGMSGAGTCATNFPEVHDLLTEVLVSPRFRLYKSKDIFGAELASCFTGPIAFVGGIADQLQLGPSIGSTLFTRGLAETSHAVARLGGKERTAFGMAGSGNLFMDIHGEGSGEFRLGKAAASTPNIADIVDDPSNAELLRSMRENLRLALSVGKGDEDLGIFRAVGGLLSKEMDIKTAIGYLMNLPVLND